MSPPPRDRKTLVAAVTTEAREQADMRSAARDAEDRFRHWLVMEDLLPLRVQLAAIAAHKLGGDPFGLFHVGGSGSLKTEMLLSCTGLPGVVLVSSVTGEASLLSGSPKREHTEESTGGLLRQVGSEGILCFKDFTSILSMQRERRAEFLGALREVLDGSWTRNIGADGARHLVWKGHCSLLAASTTALDGAHAVLSVFGNRFWQVRTGHEDRMAVARRAVANDGREPEMRKELREAVTDLYARPLVRPEGVMPGEELDQLAEVASLVSLSRSPVERDYQGEVSLVGDPDTPARAAKVLAQIRRGMLALGYSTEEAWRAVARVALDSMPKLRRLVFRTLAAANSLDTTTVAMKVAHPTRTTRRALEDLEAHGVVTRTSQGAGHADLWGLSETVLKAASLLVKEDSGDLARNVHPPQGA